MNHVMIFIPNNGAVVDVNELVAKEFAVEEIGRGNNRRERHLVRVDWRPFSVRHDDPLRLVEVKSFFVVVIRVSENEKLEKLKLKH